MRRTPAVVLTAVLALTAGCTTKPTPPAPTPATASTTATAPAPSADPADYTAGRSTPFADPIYPGHGNPGLDVLHYGLTLSWAPQTKTFTGTAVLRLRGAKAVPEIRLDFSPVYTLDEVTLNGTAVTATRDGEKLVVPAPLALDGLATLQVRYHGTPDGVPMPSHRGDIEDLGLTVAADGGLWTMQEPYGAFTWYPANDQPSDKALYDIAITVPDGWVGIANGTPAGQDGNTFRYTTTDPVASYLTTLAVGKYAKETATGPHGLPLTYWYRPAADKAMLPLLRRSPKYIEWLEERFGPYPFPSGGAVVVASQSAMETQQMITIGSFPASAIQSIDGDLLHEYAHQWFGDAVSPASWKDVWLNEGWAMYAQFLYENERDHVGDAEFEEFLRGRDAVMRSRSGPPGNPRADSFAESNVYLCPALMLHEIHQAIGDKAFFAMARDWVQQHRGTVQDRASFITFVNQHTGKDFTTMINRWLDSPTTPA